jgi:hypothetical protein
MTLQHICGRVKLPNDGGRAIIECIKKINNTLFGASDWLHMHGSFPQEVSMTSKTQISIYQVADLWMDVLPTCHQEEEN